MTATEAREWLEWFFTPERDAMRSTVHRPRFLAGQCDLCGFRRGSAGDTSRHRGYWWRGPLLRLLRGVIKAAEEDR